jgi:SnoaL-like domain
MSKTLEELLVRNLLEVFNEVDAARRREVIAELWSENGVFVDPEGVHRGAREIDETAAELFARFPGYRFSVAGAVQAQHSVVGRLAWEYGPPESPRRMTGEDICVVEEGRISALYTFVDPPRGDDSREAVGH